MDQPSRAWPSEAAADTAISRYFLASSVFDLAYHHERPSPIAAPAVISQIAFTRVAIKSAMLDTVRTTAIRSTKVVRAMGVSKHEFGALGEDFEKKEHQLFGEDGFEKICLGFEQWQRRQHH